MYFYLSKMFSSMVPENKMYKVKLQIDIKNRT